MFKLKSPYKNGHKIPLSSKKIEGEFLSNDVEELLSRAPSTLTRFSFIAIAVVFLLLFVISIVVQYPDTLDGESIVTTKPLPIRLKPLVSGRISTLFIVGDGPVKSGQTIMEMENPVGYNNIDNLQKMIDGVSICLRTKNYTRLAEYTEMKFPYLGSAQEFYNTLLYQLSELTDEDHEENYKTNLTYVENEIKDRNSIGRIALREQELMRVAQEDARLRYQTHEQLYNERVISKFELHQEAERFRQKQIAYEQYNKRKLQDKITIDSREKQISDLQFERGEKEHGLYNSVFNTIRNIQSFIQGWKQQYIVTAPFDGELFFLRQVQLNESVNSGEDLFAVVPDKKQHQAIIYLPSTGIGKAEVGQIVHIALNNYPHNEFGYIEAKVGSVSALPSPIGEGKEDPFVYKIHVALPDSLITTYRKYIPFSPELGGHARVITSDRSLLERLLSSFRN